MLRFLFPRLTDPPRRGQLLFDRVVSEARQAHWYVEGSVPDTLDGHFAMVATVCALAIVRVESADATAQSAALTERFIEAMDAEHRQMGINDPTLGTQVRKMVGALARRVEDWHAATKGAGDWSAAVQSSVYGAEPPNTDALAHSSHELAQFWQRLTATRVEDVVQGKF